MTQDPVAKLLIAVRRRVFLRVVFDSFASGIRVSAISLVGCAIIHLYFLAIPISFWLSVSLLLPLISISRTLLFDRPDLGDAAVTADQWFDGHDLITSAAYIRNKPVTPRSVSHVLVTEQAKTKAADCLQQIDSWPELRAGSQVYTAIIAGLVGLFVLTTGQPKGKDNALVGTHQAYVGGAPSGPVSLNPAATLSRHRPPGNRSAPQRGSSTQRSAAAEPAANRITGPEPDQIGPDRQSGLASNSSMGSGSSPGRDAAADNGMADRLDSSPGTHMQAENSSASEPRAISYAIERHGTSDASNFASLIPGSALIPADDLASAGNANFVGPAAAGPLARRLIAIEPSARVYINEYLERIHNE